jgi:hypothetical protein
MGPSNRFLEMGDAVIKTLLIEFSKKKSKKQEKKKQENS